VTYAVVEGTDARALSRMSTHSYLASLPRRQSAGSPLLLREVPPTLGVADGPITVVIAEDSYLIRESLVHMLGGHGRVEIVAVCSDPAAPEFAIALERPRVVLTGPRMLGSTPSEGIELAARLRRTDPKVAVLVLTRDPDAGYVEQLLEHGSSGRGYMLKHRIRHRRRADRRDRGGRPRRVSRGSRDRERSSAQDPSMPAFAPGRADRARARAVGARRRGPEQPRDSRVTRDHEAGR
jgi:CheY-like chemotaxis protein